MSTISTSRGGASHASSARPRAGGGDRNSIFFLCPVDVTPPAPPKTPQEMPADQPVTYPEPSAPSIKPPPAENPVPVRDPPQVNPPVATWLH